MKALSVLLVLALPSLASASQVGTTRVPEPGMWWLLGIAVAAMGVARIIRRK